jgi:O-antigen/teichoic acid export membrane protein
VIPILWYVSPTIQMYFLWQGFIGLIQTFLVAVCLWRSLPKSEQRARFETNLLLHVWRFAAGMSGITLFGIILLQMDKIILSKLLTLEMFGYYTMASMVAMGLYRFIAPIFNATYPEFTQLVSIGNLDALTSLYHQACQIMTVLILPIALIVAFFSSEILLLWTHNPLAVKYAHMVLSLLIIGTALNGLMTIPYALQLAYGWTKLTLYSNIIAVIILLPSIIIATRHYGPVGAACSWLSLNVGYLLIQLPIMHTRLLPTAKLKWYIHDIVFPLIASLSIILIGKLLFENMSNYDKSSLFIISYLMIVYTISLIFSILFAPEIKKLLINRKIGLF